MIDILRIKDAVSEITGVDVSVMISGKHDITFDFRWEQGLDVMCFGYTFSKLELINSGGDYNEFIIDAFKVAFENAN